MPGLKLETRLAVSADMLWKTIEWSGEFEPKGAPETDVTRMLQGIYQTGLDNLQKMFKV